MCLCCSKGGVADLVEWVCLKGWGGLRRAPIGLLLLRGGVVGGAPCCSLLFSETIKWTVISPGCLHI